MAKWTRKTRQKRRSLIQRLDNDMRYLGYTVEDAEEMTSIPKPQLLRYFRGQQQPRGDRLIQLQAYFDLIHKEANKKRVEGAAPRHDPIPLPPGAVKAQPATPTRKVKVKKRPLGARIRAPSKGWTKIDTPPRLQRTETPRTKPERPRVEWTGLALRVTWSDGTVVIVQRP